jgi:hypothetical protein
VDDFLSARQISNRFGALNENEGRVSVDDFSDKNLDRVDLVLNDAVHLVDVHGFVLLELLGGQRLVHRGAVWSV